MDIWSASQRRCSRELRFLKAFDTRNGCGATAGLSNALQFAPEAVGRLTRSLPLARPPAFPSMPLGARRLHSVRTLIYSNSIQFQSHEIEA